MKDICECDYATPPNEHGLHLHVAGERQGRMTGYGDGGNGAALSLTHTETHNVCYMGGSPWLTHIFFYSWANVPWLTQMPQSLFFFHLNEPFVLKMHA